MFQKLYFLEQIILRKAGPAIHIFLSEVKTNVPFWTWLVPTLALGAL